MPRTTAPETQASSTFAQPPSLIQRLFQGIRSLFTDESFSKGSQALSAMGGSGVSETTKPDGNPFLLSADQNDPSASSVTPPTASQQAIAENQLAALELTPQNVLSLMMRGNTPKNGFVA